MKISRIFALGGIVLAMLALSACQRSILDELAMDEETMLRRGWVAPRHLNEQTVYCYRTRSTPECYDEPEEGANTRLIGHYGNAPEDR